MRENTLMGAKPRKSVAGFFCYHLYTHLYISTKLPKTNRIVIRFLLNRFVFRKMQDEIVLDTNGYNNTSVYCRKKKKTNSNIPLAYSYNYIHQGL